MSDFIAPFEPNWVNGACQMLAFNARSVTDNSGQDKIKGEGRRDVGRHAHRTGSPKRTRCSKHQP
jgi:hypothetical protein